MPTILLQVPIALNEKLIKLAKNKKYYYPNKADNIIRILETYIDGEILR